LISDFENYVDGYVPQEAYVPQRLWEGMHMSERKYSVSEINELRRVVENMYLFGTYNLVSGGTMSRSFSESEKNIAVEQQVRTHMLAGHTADDLRKG
jgi:hypothetical protein